MKFFTIFFISMLLGANKGEENELFEYGNLTVNSISLKSLTATSLVQKFGKPKGCSQGLNEYTGEKFSLYVYNGIGFEVKKGKISLSEITSSNWKVAYKGQDISIGQSAQILHLIFPNHFKDTHNTDYQIDIRIKNTDASYMQFLVSQDKIKAITLSEYY